MGHRWTDPSTKCEFNTRVCASVATLSYLPSLHQPEAGFCGGGSLRRFSHGQQARGMVRFLWWGKPHSTWGGPGLLTQAEPSDHLLIPCSVFASQVLEELVAAAGEVG